jgi:hypothetical protein
MFPGHESLSFDDLPKGHLIMIPVPVDSESISFVGNMKYSDSKGADAERNATVCVKNSKNKKFLTLKLFNELLMSKLCEEPTSCSMVDDLKSFKEDEVVLEVDVEGKIINNASLKDGR